MNALSPSIKLQILPTGLHLLWSALIANFLGTRESFEIRDSKLVLYFILFQSTLKYIMSIHYIQEI